MNVSPSFIASFPPIHRRVRIRVPWFRFSYSCPCVARACPEPLGHEFSEVWFFWKFSDSCPATLSPIPPIPGHELGLSTIKEGARLYRNGSRFLPFPVLSISLALNIC